ncbi:MAG: histidinol-phosphate transaminase [Herminiimonas sp.]|nr:histidinol-phosphate transaminase [Herminiimonas sp.]
MPLIDTIIRPDIRAMSVYHVPDSTGFLKLDAMENPYTLPDELRAELGQRLADVAMNRYPVPSYTALKASICRHLGVPAGFDVVLGNGSDELIAMVSVACAQPGAKVLAPVPGFVMYAVSAQLAGLEFVGVPLAADFSLDLPAMLAAIALYRPAVTYLAYPNNPTGALFDADAMVQIIRAVGDTGVVIVDEAYQPFAQATFMPRLAEFPNLVVMRTVSKLGLAGIRLGYMTGSAALMTEFEKVRPPYNINVLTQCAAEFVLEHCDVLDAQAALLRAERTRVAAALDALPGVVAFPSDANFILVRVLGRGQGHGQSANDVSANLLDRKILIKNVGKMHGLLHDCLRITVSTPQENDLLLEALAAALS